MANWMNSNKKLQSALELLTTYGFMIAVAALVIILLLYLVTPVSQITPSTCSAYGNINCYNIQYYSNTISSNALLLVYLSNSGSSPANIISANAVISGQTFSGPCTTNFAYPTGNTVAYPGISSVCEIALPQTVKIGSKVTGGNSVCTYNPATRG